MMRSGKIWSVPFAALLWNYLLVFLCYTACRLIFIAVNWDYYSEYMTGQLFMSIMRGGLRFDASAICYLSVLYMLLALFPLHLKERRWFHMVSKWTMLVPVIAGVVLNLGDTVYYRYSDSRTTMAVFQEFGGEDNLLGIFLKESLHSWYLVIAGVVFIWILVRFFRLPSAEWKGRLKVYYPVQVASLVVGAALTLIGMRGGASPVLRPISMNNANAYVNRPVEAVAVVNTPFCLIRSVGKKAMPNPHYIPDDELDRVFSAVVSTAAPSLLESRPSESGSIGADGQKNVVVLILESFGTEYFGFYNRDRENYDSYTPFLDQLLDSAWTFEYNFSNGRKSIDAMPSILCGIPYINDHFITSPYALNKVTGLPGLLAGKGYSTAFFHGAPNGSMGFDAFVKSIGMQEYYGMDEFLAEPEFGGKAANDGTWGIWDEEFLQFTAHKLGQLKRPFMASLFTVSSHHPFAIPECYREVYPEGDVPIQKCIRYTDHALQRFFESMQGQEWFRNTLFVITADHTNQSAHSVYQTDRGYFNVPVVFYDPSGELKGHDVERLAQQIDIVPTVLGYLGYDRPFMSFGQNLLAEPAEETFAFNYSNGIYQLFKGSYMMQFDGHQETAFFNYRDDEMLRSNLKGTMPEVEEPMLLLLKGMVQQYVVRMLNDNLIED